MNANDAYAYYSLLLQQYQDLVKEGKIEEASAKAQEVNTAKALYDEILNSESGQ